MTTRETPVVFDCEGDRLIGILTLPDTPSSVGVLIVVGGPQYRAGSHRQFVHLARALTSAGHATFRFDYRGMGDSEGTMRTFEDVEPDIHAAARAFRSACPDVKRLVAFGLCDAASAILMAAQRIDGLAGMILANPWVRRANSLNAAIVRYYYLERVFSFELWHKIASGNLPMRSVASEFVGRVLKLLDPGVRYTRSPDSDFIDRMRVGWRLPIKRLLLLSGRDITAREFDDLRTADSRWRLDSNAVLLKEERFAEADHTFSAAAERVDAIAGCTRFLRQLSNTMV